MFIAPPADTAETAKVYASSASSFGFVMNMAEAWAWRPDFFEGFVALRSALTRDSALDERDIAVLVCATASALHDSYCSLAWGDVLSKIADAEVASAILTAQQAAGITKRDAALSDWARKVVVAPNGTTEADIEALRSVGLSDREVFEATAIVTLRVAFSSINDALGIQPDAALARLVPEAVRSAVDYGRPAAET